MATPKHFGVVIVGTGFASSFFLSTYLKNAKPGERILVLERGVIDTHEWQIRNETTSSLDHESTFVNETPEKEWLFSVGFGGCSNCWWGNTPRFLPNDFRLHTLYGVGVDWPITYAELEPFYQEAEEIMAVSGPKEDSPYPRSAAYPQPPHRLTEPDRLLKQAFPDLFFPLPTARPRISTVNRPACCATGVCYLCPADAKFTIQNEMFEVYQDPRVVVELGATVQSVDVEGGIARGVSYLQDGRLQEARGDLVVLGASAIFNPHILLRSGLEHPLLGKRLNEQIGIEVTVDLDGLENYQGSTSFTGVSYAHYDGPHRSERAALMTITNNSVQIDGLALRMERGKWRQRILLSLSIEDLPSERNHVVVNEADPTMPETHYEGFSEYSQRTIDALPELLSEMLKPLPVERMTISEPGRNLAHIQGTTVMGNEPETSVVDRDLIHHGVRNLLVLGSSTFPTCPPAMPTLTLSALSLRAASRIFGG